jgi:hypothetical protein
MATRLGIAAALLGLADFGTSRAQAQYPAGTTVYQSVTPGPPVVTYGEVFKVRRGLRKTIIKERPVAYVTPSAPIVRETQVIRPAPVVESRVVQPAPIVERRVIQPAPIVERRVVQPAPIVESRVIQPEPVIQTRYYVPYPF